MFGHDGGGDGTNAFLRIVPDRNLVVALLANHGRAGAVFGDIVGSLLEELAGIRLPELVEPDPPAAVDLGRYAGRYERNGQHVELRVEEKRLIAAWGGQYVGEPIEFTMTPLSRERFMARVPGAPRPLGIYFLGFDADDLPAYVHMTERAFARAEQR